MSETKQNNAAGQSNASSSQKMNLISISTFGHVDQGKSTFLAAVLNLLTKSVAELENLTQGINKATVNTFDNLKEEQERGVTIMANYKQVITEVSDGRKVNVIAVDCPGHSNYAKETAAGTSNADVLFLLVDVNVGVSNNTKQHLDIGVSAYGGGKHLTPDENAKILANKKLCVIINKMDILFDADLFDIVKGEIEDILQKYHFNLKNVYIMPTSALGALLYCDNPVENVQYKDFAVKLRQDLDYAIIKVLDDREERNLNQDFLMYIDSVHNVRGAGTVLAGTIQQGSLRPGDKVYVQGVNTKQPVLCAVSSIEAFHTNLPAAFAGRNIGVKLTGIKPELVRKGGILTSKLLEPAVAITVQAYFKTFAELKESTEKLQQKKAGVTRLGYEPSIVIGNNSYRACVEGVEKDGKMINLSESTRSGPEGIVPCGKPVKVKLKLKINEKIKAFIKSGSSVLFRDSNQFIGYGRIENVTTAVTTAAAA